MGRRSAFLHSTYREDDVMITSVAQVDAADCPVGEASAGPPDQLLKNLPPSGRDFEVFEHVVVGGGTTRSAAQEFKISQTRVCQVLERVRAWLDEVTPTAADEQVSQKQLQLAEGLAADRLDHLYGQAIEGWRKSEGEVERIRLTSFGERLTTRTISHGDPRYLAAAARLAILRSKIASMGVLDEAMAAAGDWEEGLESGDCSSLQADHPVGAYSGNADFGLRNADLGTNRSRATRTTAESSDPLTREQEAARRAFFGPVQEADTRDLAAAISRNGGPKIKAARVIDTHSGQLGEKESVVAGVPK
jgi:hypothetical protein